jgi:hypothetical protein
MFEMGFYTFINSSYYLKAFAIEAWFVYRADFEVLYALSTAE